MKGKAVIRIENSHEQKRKYKRDRERERQEYAAEQERQRTQNLKKQALGSKGKRRARTRRNEQEVEFESGEEVDSEDELSNELSKAISEQHSVPSKIRVIMECGTAITSYAAKFKIMTMLKEMDTYQNIDYLTVLKKTGIDLSAEENCDFVHALKNTEGISLVDLPCEKPAVRRVAFQGIENEDCLRKAFKHVLTIHESDLQKTYSSVEKDLDTLVANGEVEYFMDERCTKERQKCRVFLATLPGVQCCPGVRKLWNDIKLPDTHAEIRKELLARKIRTKAFYDERSALTKDRNDAQRAEEKRLKEMKQNAVRVGKGKLEKGDVDDLL